MLASAVIVSFLLNGLQFKYLVKILGIELSFREWFGLSVTNTMFNYYLPARSGNAIRAYYLKKKHHLKYSHFVSLFGALYIIIFTFSAILGIIAVFLTKVFYGIFYSQILIVFILILSLIIIGLIISYYLLKIGKNIKILGINDFLNSLSEGFQVFLNNIKLVAIVTIFNFLFIMASGLRLYICFQSINLTIMPLQMLIIISLTVFAIILPILPGNLGIKEGVISFSAFMLHISVKKVALGAMIDRGAEMILVLILGIILSEILLKDLKFYQT